MSEVVTNIESMFREERANPVKVTSADQVPLEYESITAEWLTDALCRPAPGATVTGFSFGPADDGSSNRRRIYLDYNETGQSAGLPRTVFCKATMSLASRLILGPTGTGRGEVDFYNKVRPQLNIEAPRALHARYDAERFAYIVILEDDADRVIFCDHNTEITWDRAVSQVHLLADLHGKFYESPELGTDALPFHTWPDFWSNMLFHAPSFAPSCDIGFGAAQSVIPEPIFARRNEIWDYTLRSVEMHRQLPRSLIHCDVHLRNWYLTHEGQPGLADWQILSIGHWSRDFIYVVVSCLTIENRRSWLEPLLKTYLERLASHGVAPPEPGEALRLCRQQLFSALAFWTITLRPAEHMPDMQPPEASLTFIERMAHAMHDLDSFGAF